MHSLPPTCLTYLQIAEKLYNGKVSVLGGWRKGGVCVCERERERREGEIGIDMIFCVIY
jgi:hypothetical protein